MNDYDVLIMSNFLHQKRMTIFFFNNKKMNILKKDYVHKRCLE